MISLFWHLNHDYFFWAIFDSFTTFFSLAFDDFTQSFNKFRFVAFHTIRQFKHTLVFRYKFFLFSIFSSHFFSFDSAWSAKFWYETDLSSGRRRALCVAILLIYNEINLINMANVPTTTKTTNSYMIKWRRQRHNRTDSYTCVCVNGNFEVNWFVPFVAERFVDFYGAVHRFDTNGCEKCCCFCCCYKKIFHIQCSFVCLAF